MRRPAVGNGGVDMGRLLALGRNLRLADHALRLLGVGNELLPAAFLDPVDEPAWPSNPRRSSFRRSLSEGVVLAAGGCCACTAMTHRPPKAKTSVSTAILSLSTAISEIVSNRGKTTRFTPKARW